MIGSMLKRGAGRHAEALRLLDKERDVLLGGPLTELAALVARREALMTEILADGAPPPEGFLALVKAKAERNSRLMLASLAGLRAARDQIDAAENAGRTLKTYTADGASVEVADRPKTRDERR